MTTPETQPERTALAASRTAASAFVLGFVFLRLGLIRGARPITILAIAALATALLEVVLSYREYLHGHYRLPAAALTLALAVVLISVAGLISAFTMA